MLLGMLIALFVWAVEPSTSHAQERVAAGTEVQTVQKLVNRLSSSDPIDSERAELGIELLPESYLPVVQDQAKRADLSPFAKSALAKALSRLEPRTRWEHKKQIRSQLVVDAIEQVVLNDAKRHANGATWLEAVQQCIELDNQQSHADTKKLQRDVRTRELQRMEAAINAGCEDPAFLTLYGLRLFDSGAPEGKVISVFKRAREKSKALDVAPYMAFVMNRRLLAGKPDDTNPHDPSVSPIIDDMVHAFCKVLEDPATPSQMKISGAQALLETAHHSHITIKPLYDKVLVALVNQLPGDSQVQAFKGKCLTDMAWEARGGDVAGNVTPQGWADFNARLQTAADALEASYKLDPADPTAATQMITVIMGREGSRALMETWFKRAMDADPDNIDACKAKMLYLEPKWGGDPTAMLQFGHEALDDGNWVTPTIPLLLENAHHRLAAYEQNPDQYYLKPGVWDDLRACYEKALEVDPDNTTTRSLYSRDACLCQQWKVADAQFKMLGDNVHLSAFKGPQELAEFKREASQGAANP